MIWDFIKTRLEYHRFLRRRAGIKPVNRGEPLTLATILDEQVLRQPNATMILTRDEEITWLQFQQLSNAVTDLMLSRGVTKGDVVPLIMENSIEYLACIVGVSRLGAIAALINTNITGPQLMHCLTQVNPVMILVDEQGMNSLLDNEQSYQEQLGDTVPVLFFGVQQAEKKSWLYDGSALLKMACRDVPTVPDVVYAGDTALYIYTSGSTGFPKASLISHGKFVAGSRNFATLGYRASTSDRMYVCLPLYHGTGLIVGVGSCFHSGASFFLRKKFSASQWLDEVTEYRCNLFVYVGEICRYLLDTPPSSEDRACPVKTMAGNGLRPDVWKPFKKRFGVNRVCEFYGATEANGGTLNVLNKDETIGMSLDTIRLVKYSMDDGQPVRDRDGHLQICAPGEPGLLLIQEFPEQPSDSDRYVNRDANELKVIRNAFADGDCWFNSGDVVKQIDVGYSCGIPHYQFVDRLGDTYRWKSENVSTIEVADILCRHGPVLCAVVYGVAVSGVDGKAGMATIVFSGDVEDFIFSGFSQYIFEKMSNFTRPLFIRIKRDLDATGTYKFSKQKLVEEGYDINQVSDVIYCMRPDQSGYEKLTGQRYREIVEGRSGY